LGARRTLTHGQIAIPEKDGERSIQTLFDAHRATAQPGTDRRPCNLIQLAGEAQGVVVADLPGFYMTETG